MPKPTNEQQIGGSHYMSMPKGYQPIDLAYALNLSVAQFSILKYLLRYKRKNGSEDVKKMIHYAQIILEKEYGISSEIKYGTDPWVCTKEKSEEPIPD